MAQYKLIFTGPVGAGKTTAIAALSDTPVVNTDELASDMAGIRKATTTVALDFGTLRLDDGEQVHLYGTPGQERFDFMWDILTEGGLGLILLIDNSRPHPLRDLDFYIDAFQTFIEQTDMVIGVTRLDEHTSPPLRQFNTHLRERGLMAPVFEIDARKRADVAILVRALLYKIDPSIGKQ